MRGKETLQRIVVWPLLPEVTFYSTMRSLDPGEPVGNAEAMLPFRSCASMDNVVVSGMSKWKKSIQGTSLS